MRQLIMLALMTCCVYGFGNAGAQSQPNAIPLCGDANHDGKVTAADATRIQSVARGKRRLKKDEPNTFDLNLDGKIDRSDWETAMAIAIGKMSCAPCPADPKSCTANPKKLPEKQ